MKFRQEFRKVQGKSALSELRLRTLAAVCLFFCCVLFIGCDDSPVGDSGRSHRSAGQDQTEPQPRWSDGLDGTAILEKLIARYATAKTYQDRGKLYLNYRLQGRAIQEPHAFSTVWDSRGGLSLRIFNSHVQCNLRLLSCYVFDNDSANLDNQQLFLSAGQQIPLTELYSDALVRHFVGGYADLPLDETEKPQPPKLIPPPASLLLRQLPFGWIEQAAQVQRLDDQTIDGQLCYVVRSLYGESTADILVNQQTLLLVQVSLPLRLMARPVLTSGEIENVELIAKFHDASVNVPIDAQVFRTQPQAEALPVRRFIPIPEPFPSDLIGETAPRFDLLQSEGRTIDRRYFDGKPTALLWVNGDSAVESVKKFSAAIKQFPATEFRFGIVYSEAELAEPDAGTLVPSAELSDVAEATGLPLYFDRQLQASTLFRIKSIPAVIVMNGDARVEFARTLSDKKWPDDVTAALQRVKSGDNVAAEMKLEYQHFLEDFHQQLLVVSANDLLGLKPTEKKVDANQRQVLVGNPDALAFKKTGAGQLQAKLDWSNKDFQRAGNIYFSDTTQNSTLLVLDGWRTIAELSHDGHSLARHELELPDEVAISCLRVFNHSDAQPDPANAKYAAFNVKGKQVFLYNHDWQPVATLPDEQFPHAGILDVSFIESSAGTGQRVAVSYAGDQGCFVFDLENRTTKQISKVSPSSLAAISRQLFYCSSDFIGILGEEKELIAVPAGLRFAKMAAFQTSNRTAFATTVADTDNHWNLAGSGHDGKIGWYQPIGSQLFETEVEPLTSMVDVDGTVLLAVADNENQISFFNEEGVFKGQMTIPASITGLGLLRSNDATFAMVSTSAGVSCYRLAFQ